MKRCKNCGEVFPDNRNHQCTNELLDTIIDVGITVAVSSLFDSDSDSSSSSDSSSFDGFDGGDFGGGGSSSDW